MSGYVDGKENDSIKNYNRTNTVGSTKPVPIGLYTTSHITQVTACNEWLEEGSCVLERNIAQTYQTRLFN
jgi:hypothetical protein